MPLIIGMFLDAIFGVRNEKKYDNGRFINIVKVYRGIFVVIGFYALFIGLYKEVVGV